VTAVADGLPPGPSLPLGAQALWYHRDPLRFLRWARRRYGDVFTIRMPLKDPIVVVAAPSEARRLLQADPVAAEAGATRRLILPLASPRSPFGGDGAVHADVRARMAPDFEPAKVATWAGAIEQLAREQVATWPVGRPFRLLPRMRTLATTITVRHVLGVEDPPRARRLVLAIRRMLWTPGNPPMPVPGAGDGPLGAVVTTVFERRLALVRRLLAEESLDLDEWAVVIAAAQEPPAIALTNVVLELARDQRLQRSFADAGPGPSQQAVVDEVLRLRPSASAGLRRLRAPMEVAGQRLPGGTHVLVPFPLLHRDAGHFAEPDRLRPERWATEPPGDVPFYPFGDGARRCLGEPLARLELAHVLATVLDHLRFEPVWPVPERMVVRGTVLVPHRSGLVRARPAPAEPT
jgi:cytochrome P450